MELTKEQIIKMVKEEIASLKSDAKERDEWPDGVEYAQVLTLEWVLNLLEQK